MSNLKVARPDRRCRARALATATALLAVLAGGTTAIASGSGTTPTTGEDVTLRWQMWTGPEDQPLFESMADLVTEQYPNIHVEFEPTTFADHFTGLVTAAAAGNLPCLAGLQSLRTLGFGDVFVPLDDMVASSGLDIEDFNPTILDGLTLDGNVLALPYDVGPVLVFYNKDAFADAGVAEPALDWTADDFQAAAEGVASDDIDGVALWSDIFFVEPMIYGYNGSRLVDEANQITLDNPDTVAGLEWYVDLASSDAATPMGGANYNPTALFSSGEAAMTTGGPWDIQPILADADFEIGVAVVPGGRTLSAGSGFGITQDCDHPDEAFQALSVLTGPEALAMIAEAGRGYPARESQTQLYYDNFPVATEALTTSWEQAEPFRGAELYDQLNTQVIQFLPSAVSGDISVEDMIADVQNAVGA